MKTLYMLKFKYKGKFHFKIGYATSFEYRKEMFKKALVAHKIKAKLHTCFAIKVPFAKEIELLAHAYLESRGYRYKHTIPKTVSGYSEIYIF